MAIDRSPEINELFAALAKAQAEIRIAGKESRNQFLKSKYADLVSVVNASRPALAKNGLSVMQSMDTDEEGRRYLVTILGHSSGQYMSSRIDIPYYPPSADPSKKETLRDFFQSFGACVTYLRRYAYASIVGVIADEEDDDGSSISERPYAPPVQKPKAPDVPITKEELEMLDRKLAGKPELAQNIKDFYKLKELADLPKSLLYPILDRIEKIEEASR
jgi:hypothetical protein